MSSTLARLPRRETTFESSPRELTKALEIGAFAVRRRKAPGVCPCRGPSQSRVTDAERPVTAVQKP
jgi:hypothetical protein